MLAEGFHSTADSVNQVMLLIGHKRAAKPPDESHPFGYGKELYFWAFVVAVVALAAGAGDVELVKRAGLMVLLRLRRRRDDGTNSIPSSPCRPP